MAKRQNKANSKEKVPKLPKPKVKKAKRQIKTKSEPKPKEKVQKLKKYKSNKSTNFQIDKNNNDKNNTQLKSSISKNKIDSKITYSSLEEIQIPCFITTIKNLKFLPINNLILIGSLDTIALLSYDPKAQKIDQEKDDPRFKMLTYGFLNNDKIDCILELKNGWIALSSKKNLIVYEIVHTSKELKVIFSHYYPYESHSINLFQLNDGTIINVKLNSISKFKVDLKNKSIRLLEEFNLNLKQTLPQNNFSIYPPYNQSLLSNASNNESIDYYESIYLKDINTLYIFNGLEMYEYCIGTQNEKITKVKSITLTDSKKIKEKAEGKLFYKPFLVNDCKIIYYVDKSIKILDGKNHLKSLANLNLKEKIMYMRAINENKYVAIGDKKGNIFIYDITNKFKKINEFKFSDSSVLSINELLGNRIISYVDHSRYSIVNYETGKIELLTSVKNSKNMRRGILLPDGAYLTGSANGFLLIK